MRYFFQDTKKYAIKSQSLKYLFLFFKLIQKLTLKKKNIRLYQYIKHKVYRFIKYLI